MRRDNNVGNMLTELRRSNAAGFHNSTTTRTQQNREEIEMSILDGEYPLSRTMDDWGEPTADELDAIELEDGYDRNEEDIETLYRYAPGDYEDLDMSFFDDQDPYDSEYDVP